MAADEAQLPAAAALSGFSRGRRRFIVGLVSAAGLLGPLAGGIYLPALPVLERDFAVGGTAINATVSAFMAVCAFAPLFWSGFADWKGRRPLYILSLAVYLASNVLLAALPANFGALVFLRMVQAFGCSSVISLGAGTVADVTGPAQRGVAMAIFLLGPNLGPTLGPVLGGVITGQASWRWTFGLLCILVGLTLLVVVLALPETLRSRVGDGSVYAGSGPVLLPIRFSSPLAPAAARAPPPPKPSMALFWRLLCYPPIGISCVYNALLFANYFAIAVNLPVTLMDGYRWSGTGVGGGYVALGVAITAGSLVTGRFSDWRRARIAQKSATGHVEPEARLLDHLWGSLLCAAGSVMYGWCVAHSVHPAAVIVATFFAGFGMSSVLVGTFAFLTECAPQATAGAMALENMVRNPAAAAAAVVTPPLIAKMGIGWFFTGFSLLSVVSVGLGALGKLHFYTNISGGPGDWVVSNGMAALSRYGPAWRAKFVSATSHTITTPTSSGTNIPGEKPETEPKTAGV